MGMISVLEYRVEELERENAALRERLDRELPYVAARELAMDLIKLRPPSDPE